MKTISILILTIMSITSNMAQESTYDKSSRLAKWKQGERFTYNYEMILPSTPDSVFPLLCPILEYDWLNHWKCTMVYSSSGVAENNCIFYQSSGFPLFRRKTFQVIDYRPNERIEFLIFIQHIGSVRFTLNLELLETNRTKMTCDYILTGHSGFGNKRLKKFREKEIEIQVRELEKDLVYWLKNNSKRPLP